MSNIDSLIMNAATTAAQQTQQAPVQQAVEVQQEFIPANQYIPQQAQYQQQPMQQAQYQQQPMQQAQYQQQPVQQAQYQQQPVQQAQYQQQPVQQAQYQQQPMQQAQYQQQPVQQAQHQQQPVQQAQYQQQPMQQAPYQQQPVQQAPQTGMIQHQAAGQVAHQPMTQQPMMPNGQVPAHLMQMPTTFNMDSFMSMGLAVDLWLKPDYVGMTIGDNTIPVEAVIVEIDMTEGAGFTPVMAIRFGKDPVRYDYTRDGITNKDGMSWQQAIYGAYGIDPSVSPYRAVQIPMVVVEDCKNMKGEVVANRGASLGYTTSVTNWSQWEELYRNCARNNMIGKKVVVKLTNVPKAKNNNKWGIVHFELLGAAADHKVA